MKLISERKLVAQLGGPFTASSVRRLRNRGLIPFVRLGYRTILYDHDRVLEALARCEVKAMSTHARQQKASSR